MTMISGDVIMKLFPKPLNDVVIWRVGRQEVQYDSPAQRLERGLLESAFELPNHCASFNLLHPIPPDHDVDWC